MNIIGKSLVVILLALTACQSSQVTMNTPLKSDTAPAALHQPGYTLMGMLQQPRGEILLALAFSGGGKRSAAFAYGALLGLRSMTIMENNHQRRMLDEVDYIAAVSGGSFPAMHYGLYRDESFNTFKDDFLYRDVNAFVWGIYLLPWNWEWLINPLFGTNDAMAQVYDRLMFHGATYADLARRGPPMISVNATDLAGGSAFAFSQSNFDLLCSDLSTFPIARAVAASAAFPILFTPITLTSYRSGCTTAPPPGVALQRTDNDSAKLARTSVLARNTARLIDPDRTRFVHLIDGGVADNLALRVLSNTLVVLDEDDAELRRLAAITRRVIIISVDGQAVVDPTLGERRVVSGIGQILSAVSGSQIDAYSFETLLLADEQVGKLTEKIQRLRCEQGTIVNGHACNDVKGALIQISLNGINDDEKRRRLQAIPTSLTIPHDDVNALVNEGANLIRTNPKLLDLISDFNAQTGAAIAANSSAR